MSSSAPRSAVPFCPEVAGGVLRALVEDDAPDAGTGGVPVVPGYRIEHEIGRGGTGRVYRAFREGSDRPLALKLLRQNLGLTAIRRAWRELELLESLRLPVVPRIVDYGVHDGTLYFAEEFVDGLDLDRACDALAQGDLRGRVELLASAARAVHSIHERGIIHRDVKPSNILVKADGNVLIVDFGLALQTGAEGHTLTETGTPIGTPAFMAPEQARGDREAASTRVDVYGLGATAYRILTGSTPHDTQTSLHEAIRRVASEPPRDPRLLRGDLPRPLAAVCAKACAALAGDRYHSAGEFAADLQRWLDGQPVEAQPPSRWAMATRWAARHPIAATALACMVVGGGVLLGTAAATWWLAMKPAGLKSTKDRSQLSIVSRLGMPIAAWTTDPWGIGGHALLELPGSPRLLAVAFSNEPIGTSLNRELCVFDYDGGGTLVWKSGVGPLGFDSPVKAGTTKHDQYVAFRMIAADVFDDPPGPEIIAAHANNGYSACAIRVYDPRNGEVLYEAWHDGSISGLAWLEEARMLVCAGVSSEQTYGQLGFDTEQVGVMVVFGVSPRPGRWGWITTPTTPDPAGERDVRVAWYKYFGPPEALGPFDWELLNLDPRVSADLVGNACRVWLTLTDNSGGVCWTVRSDGTATGPVIADGYKSRPGLPSAGQLWLRPELPRRQSP